MSTCFPEDTGVEEDVDFELLEDGVEDDFPASRAFIFAMVFWLYDFEAVEADIVFFFLVAIFKIGWSYTGHYDNLPRPHRRT